MVIIKPEDLKIMVGLEAYETFIGREVPNRNISVIRYGHSTGVYIKHLPTGLFSYSNEYRSQVKNKDKALLELNRLVNKADI